MKNQQVKTITICLVLMLSVSLAKATNYYFSRSIGNDSYSALLAQNPLTPWKSLAKLNAIFSSLQPGDHIYFQRGDVFEGTITVTASGSNSNPIVLQAYGIGNNPVISGLTNITDWSSAGNNVWAANVPAGKEAMNIFLLNGTAQRMGRFPNATESNAGYLTLETFSGNSSITDYQLSASPNWGGGEVVIRKNRWVLDRNKITSHNGNSIQYISESGYHASNNYGYFIQNHPNTLDQNGEWYYNNTTKKTGIYSGSLPSSVEVSVVNTLVSITNQNNITLQDIIFKGANQNALELSNAQGISIINCEILFSGANAVLALGSNGLRVDGCYIYHTNNSALELRNSWNAIIKNNKIKATGVFAGMGKGDSGSYEAILMDGDNELVEGNEIDSTGYIPITFRGNTNIIKNNFISNYNFVKDDGGGIYTWNNIAGAPPTYGSKILFNILLNGTGAGGGTDDPGYEAANGIYMDDNTAGVEISNNSVANCGLFGLYVHNGYGLTVTNNTFFNSKSQVVLAHDNYAPQAPIRNVTMQNNIFFSKDNSQLVAEFKTPNNDIANFGSFDNNYYCRPGYENYIINTAVNADAFNLDLNEWKILFGKDANSTKFPASLSSYRDIRFEYNASSSSKTISLDGIYIDAKNAAYNGSITLAPFTSAVLVKQGNGNTACTGTGSVTREQWNNTINGDLDVVPFHAVPTKTTSLSGALEAGNIGDAYASRIRGFVCPPLSGNYIFWIAGDDFGELWLSTDANPANKRKIANLSGYTNFRDWNKNASQKSAAINLQAGVKYYMEVLQKEGNGGDHVSVAWQMPDGVFEGPVAAKNLSPFVTGISLANQTINFPPLSNILFGGGTVSLTATASSGLPINFSIVSGPATLNGNVVTPTAAGTIVIKASQAGNAQYNPASDVLQNLVVTGVNNGVQCAASGTILREQWSGINGNDVAQIPLSATPSSVSQLSLFEGPHDFANQYGSRIRGYICPPQTGNYTFFIAGDDGTELWLSTNDNPSNKTKIAYSLNWTNFREWNRYTSQKSATIYLQAGTKYYVEALQKEGDGGDHLSVAWQLPDGTMEAPIAGSRLSPYQPTTALQNQTISFTALQDFTLGSAPLTLSATASSGLLVSFGVVSGSATISGNVVTPTAAGTIVIKASQAGNAQYNAAPDVVQSLLVVPAQTAQCSATGNILREQWNDVDGNDIVQIPLALQASLTNQISLFEGPQNTDNRYGSRIRGYICPPQTGNYIFFIAGDDATELWLSTDDNPSNKTKIAYSLLWTNFREWTRYSTQTSSPIYLEAGKKYYVEALQKEGGGGDHLSVAWQMPDGVFEAPINGSRLSPYTATSSQSSQSINFLSLGTFTLASQPIVLSATATSGLPVSFSIVSGPASLNGNLLTPTGVGTVVIKASQSGNTQYSAAPEVIQNLVVVSLLSEACTASGSILREQWNKIQGNDVVQIPQSSQPSSSSQVTLFEGPKDIADEYGSRIRGYICAPQTGDYTFWIAGDDGIELWLSSDDNPSNKIKIAYALSWTYYREWNRYASQKSISIYLQAGKKYYVEALQKEGAGGDHLSVAWQLPDGAIEAPIAGSRLSPFIATSANHSLKQAIKTKTEEAKQINESMVKAFPNPFVNESIIEVVSAEAGEGTIEVIDMYGRNVHRLFSGKLKAATTYRFLLDNFRLSSGMYVIRLTTSNNVISHKLIKRTSK